MRPLLQACDLPPGQAGHGPALLPRKAGAQALRHGGGGLGALGRGHRRPQGQAGGDGGHNYVLYDAHSGQDGRYVCLDCGRHCVKWKKLVARPCPGVPQRPKYARAPTGPGGAGAGPQCDSQGCEVPNRLHGCCGRATCGGLRRGGPLKCAAQDGAGSPGLPRGGAPGRPGGGPRAGRGWAGARRPARTPAGGTAAAGPEGHT